MNPEHGLVGTLHAGLSPHFSSKDFWNAHLIPQALELLNMVCESNFTPCFSAINFEMHTKWSLSDLFKEQSALQPLALFKPSALSLPPV